MNLGNLCLFVGSANECVCVVFLRQACCDENENWRWTGHVEPREHCVGGFSVSEIWQPKPCELYDLHNHNSDPLVAGIEMYFGPGIGTFFSHCWARATCVETALHAKGIKAACLSIVRFVIGHALAIRHFLLCGYMSQIRRRLASPPSLL